MYLVAENNNNHGYNSVIQGAILTRTSMVLEKNYIFDYFY